MRISTSQSDLASVSSTMTNDNSAAATRGSKAAKGSTQEGQPGRKLPPLMRTRSKSTSDLTGTAGARKAEEESKSTEERGSLVKNRRLQLTRRLSQGRVEVPEGEQQQQQPKNADGLVANRRRHFTRRMSTGNASCGCPTSGASRNNNSSNGSFSSLPGGAPRKHLHTCKSFPNSTSSEDLSGQRVATLRERFNSSMSTLGSSQSTLDIGYNSSHHSLYGRASGHGSCHSIAESSIDDNDDSSVGSFGQDDDDEDLKEEGSSFALHFSSGALELKDDDEEDNLKMESTKSKNSNNNSKSFNSSFLTVGGSGKDCLQTGRGSIFVIGDSRLGNTKVIQSKLNKSATKIQRFFRYSMAILSLHREEIEYHRESLKDVERRRQEELEEVQRMLEIQKQQFLLQMEYETRSKLEEKLERNHKLLDEVEEQLEVEQKERAELGASILKLKHENLHLKYQSNDPELEDKMRDLKASIQLARLHRAGYKETYDNLKIAVGDYEARILVCKQETDKEQHKISVLKKYLGRITKLVPSSLVNGSSDKDGHADEVAKAADVAAEGVCEAHVKKESTTAKDVTVKTDVKADAAGGTKVAAKKAAKKEPKASKKQRRASSEKKRESMTEKCSESSNPLMEIITGAAGPTADQSSSKSRDREGSMAFTESTTSLTGSRGSMSMHNSSSALLSLIEVGGGSVSVSSGLALVGPEAEAAGSKSKSKRSSSKSDKDKKDKDKKEKKDKKKSSRRSSSTDSTSISSKKSSSKSTSGNGKSSSSSKSKRSSKTTKRHSFDSALGQLVTG